MNTNPSLLARTACTLLAAAGLSATTAFAAEPEAPAPAPAPVTARTWLNAQTNGTLASAHRQSLSGPMISQVHQKMLRQLSSGKTGGDDASATGSGDAKDKPSGGASNASGGAN